MNTGTDLTIDQDGNQLVWIAKYWRYHRLEEFEADSLEEAVEFLEQGEGKGDLSSDSIVGPDGRVVHDFNQGGLGNTIWAFSRELQRQRGNDT